MSAINRLSTVTTLTSADIVALFSANAGNDSGATLATLLAWLQSNLTANGSFATQYASPGATGFSVTVSPLATGGDVYLLLSPGATYAAGTIVLPVATDGQRVLVHTRQTVTALTVTPQTGDSTSGAPTTLSAGAFFELRYDLVNKLWCRVG